ncbi:hypothetical protein TH53_17925 [Pedobacter lusitanus]|uniref:PKD domain-containing protein n=1 Tax=Pedobacter lusitanus TaxID=1503925 RepID=A0A0D0GIM2_9SPHI|nr:leucine-rich repeat protein [Pedobacter lusitanus]KIO75940.1 hypothetical protein TH53_17925 [Pedobacter lusitanus]
MAKQALNTIKNWFKTGLKPSQQQFWDTWDSFLHKDEMIPTASIENLDRRFDEKADQEAFSGHLADAIAHGSNKVDKEPGKGLSSNDYTAQDKQKLDRLYNFDDTEILDQLEVINLKNTTQDTDIAGLKDLAATINSKENIIAPGTTAQYFRGDKTWQTLDKGIVGLNNLPVYTTNYDALEGGLGDGDFYRMPEFLGNYAVAAASVNMASPIIITLTVIRDNYTMSDGSVIYSSSGRPIDFFIDYGDGDSQKSNGITAAIKHTYKKAGTYKIKLFFSDYSMVNSVYISDSCVTKTENISRLKDLPLFTVSKGNLGYFNTKMPSRLQVFALSNGEDGKNNDIVTGIDLDIFNDHISSYLAIQILATALNKIDFNVGLPASLDNIVISMNKQLKNINLDMFKNCVNLRSIDFNLNDNLSEVNSTISLPSSLTRFSMDTSKITSFNPDRFKNCLNLSFIAIEKSNLASFTPLVFLSQRLKQLNLKGNKFSVEEVNNILIDLDKLEFTSLSVELNNQNPPAVPTGAGLAAKERLIAKGFSITTDTAAVE